MKWPVERIYMISSTLQNTMSWACTHSTASSPQRQSDASLTHSNAILSHPNSIYFNPNCCQICCHQESG